MTRISANELKKSGVSALEHAVKSGEETVITVRGTDKYVVLEMEEYHRLRECELDSALTETRRDLAEGKFVEQSIEEHLRHLSE